MRRFKDQSYQQTAHITFLPTSTTTGSDNRSVTYAGVNINNDHLRGDDAADTMQLLLANDDSAKSILITRVACYHGEVDIATQPMGSEGGTYHPYMGTLACSGAGNDIIRYASNTTGNDYVSNVPIALPPATSLVHYSLQGPSTGNTYSLVINYRMIDAVTGVTVEPETDFVGGGGDDGGDDPGGAPPPSGGR